MFEDCEDILMSQDIHYYVNSKKILSETNVVIQTKEFTEEIRYLRKKTRIKSRVKSGNITGLEISFFVWYSNYIF